VCFLGDRVGVVGEVGSLTSASRSEINLWDLVRPSLDIVRGVSLLQISSAIRRGNEYFWVEIWAGAFAIGVS
jgi:hypothetical protein